MRSKIDTNDFLNFLFSMLMTLLTNLPLSFWKNWDKSSLLLNSLSASSTKWSNKLKTIHGQHNSRPIVWVCLTEAEAFLMFFKDITNTMQQWTPGIKINKSNKSKVKNPTTDTPRIFGGTSQHSIFFAASTETNNQLDTSYSFPFFKI